MTVIWTSHSELYRTEEEIERWGVSHNTLSRESMDKIDRLSKLVIDYVRRDPDGLGGKVTTLLTGEGYRYEEVFDGLVYLLEPEECFHCKLGVSFMLGGGSSKMSATGLVYTPGGHMFFSDDCCFLNDVVTPSQAWDYVKKEDEERGGYKLFSSGRQQWSLLGLPKKDFYINSACVLDWRMRSYRFIVRNGEPV